MESQFQVAFRRDLESLTDGQASGLSDIRALSGPIASKVLVLMLESACKGQSMNAIQTGRDGVRELPRAWVLEEIGDAARRCLDLEDEYEFRRLVELLLPLAPELARRFVDEGVQGANERVREAAADFKEAMDRVPRPEPLCFVGPQSYQPAKELPIVQEERA